jgi:hypothetical protein
MTMLTQCTPLERAFELARSGECALVSDVRRRLKDEGYSDAQLDGPSLIRQLRGLLATAKAQGEMDRP